MSVSELEYCIAFAMIRGMNMTMAKQLLGSLGSEQAFFEASARSLGSLTGLRSGITDAGYRAKLLDQARKEYDFVNQHHIKCLYFTDDNWPWRLTEAQDAPILLYTCGALDLNAQRIISVVGTRHATPYGIDFTDRLISDLSHMLPQAPLIVSGLAYGIDATAHSSALRHHAPTAAVLAHGLNTIYPSAHRQLASDIISQGGVLLTEYPHTAATHRGNFLARNRIVAALSDCTIVVESASKGGALVTAHLAAEYNREVLALPGRISDTYSAGCNQLISQCSATLLESAQQLIQLMGWPTAKPDASPANQPQLFPQLTDLEQQVIDYISQHGDSTPAQIATQTGLNVGRAMSLLVDMEFQGLLLAWPGGKYRLA